MFQQAVSPIVYLVIISLMPALWACSAKPNLRVANHEITPISFAEGRRLLEEGRAVEAVEAFRAALRKGGASVSGLNGLAIAYGELGKPDLAAEMFARALALKPNDPATLNNIGFAALRRADVELARHYLERAGAGKGDLAEISGNLKGLALLEKAERELPARRASLRAAFHNNETDPKPAIHLSIARPAPDLGPSSHSKPASSTATLIDFAAVNDPFSDPLTAE